MVIAFTFAKNKTMKIGVIGAGHLGQFHLMQIAQISQWQLMGFYDSNIDRAGEMAEKHKCTSFKSIDDLINAVDVVDIVTPTLSHFEIAANAIKKGKHVFIEKPVTNTVAEAETLIELAKEFNVKIQVGHIERFNPAFRASVKSISNPQFIECHRLAQFNPRGTDVSVVLDLMIHDLDIILSTVKSDVKNISASGVSVISDTPDIANARIEFNNGCVANLTASRISMKNMRKSRFFQKDAYVSVDFLEKKSEIIQMKSVDENTDDFAIIFDPGAEKEKKEILFNNPKIQESNAINDELQAFYNSIYNNTDCIVTLNDAYKALKTAHQILNTIGKQTISA